VGRYRKYFEKTIKANFPGNHVQILFKTNEHYKAISQDTVFAATSANPIDRRLDFSSYFLALIKTLEEEGESFDTIRKNCLEITINYVTPKSQLEVFIKRLPVKLMNTLLAKYLVKKLAGRVSKKGHPDGFRANIITSKDETFGLGYGVDILECGICKLFKKHNNIRYVPILCEVDKITSAFAGLQMIRTGTIAAGAKKCDFRYRKME
jgi:hypothetical protein